MNITMDKVYYKKTNTNVHSFDGHKQFYNIYIYLNKFASIDNIAAL